jgi:hypothetical protein
LIFANFKSILKSIIKEVIEGDTTDVLKYIIRYTENGKQGKIKAYTYDIETYIKNLTARRKQIQIIGYETI